MTTLDLVQRAITEAQLPPLERLAWVEVDIGALRANAEALAEIVQPACLGVVVKADGYGHGLEVAARAALAGGALVLIVATIGEAMRLRADGYTGDLLVLYPVPEGVLEWASANRVTITIGNLADLDLILDAGCSQRAHVEVDTGMGRGGVSAEDLRAFLDRVRRLPEVSVEGVWSHLYDPDDAGASADQASRFSRIVSEIEQSLGHSVESHLCSSGGIEGGMGGHRTVRAGLVYYGLSALAGREPPKGISPALRLRAVPVRSGVVGVGGTVGYGGDWVASRRTRVATLPLGYVDGWPRRMSPGGQVASGGRRYPVVGRISSDAITIDVSELAGDPLVTVFDLIGPTLPATEQAQHRGTIVWEVLQQLSGRLPRIYVYEGEVVGIRPEAQVTVHWSPRTPSWMSHHYAIEGSERGI